MGLIKLPNLFQYDGPEDENDVQGEVEVTKTTNKEFKNKTILVEPRAFSEAQQIADYLKARNQVVVLAARNFIIRQELNPYIINPFVVMNILQDPDTKRGFVYLKTALQMKEKSQQIFINQLKYYNYDNAKSKQPKEEFLHRGD